MQNEDKLTRIIFEPRLVPSSRSLLQILALIVNDVEEVCRCSHGYIEFGPIAYRICRESWRCDSPHCNVKFIAADRWCRIILYERCASKSGVVLRLHHVDCFLDFTKFVTICEFFPMAWRQKCCQVYYNEQYSFLSFHFAVNRYIYMCMHDFSNKVAKLRHNQSLWIALQLEYETISSWRPTWIHCLQRML